MNQSNGVVTYPGCRSLAQSTPNETIPITDHRPFEKSDNIGPPESPAQESLRPWPAQTMSSLIFTRLTPR